MPFAPDARSPVRSLRDVYSARLDLARQAHQAGRVPTLVTAELGRPTPNAAIYQRGLLTPEGDSSSHRDSSAEVGSRN